MPRTILVPIDGSPFSELAIKPALEIARRVRAEVEFVFVNEPVPAPGETQGAPVLDPRLTNDLRTERLAYLGALTARLRGVATVDIEGTLLEGPVAATLAEHIVERGTELVVMTTHGRGGFSRMWLGSVADALVRRTQVPVLLIKPVEGAPVAGSFTRVVVPLDGSALSEQVLGHAVAMCGTEGVEYALVRVVPPFDRPYLGMVTGVGHRRPAPRRSEAEAYLEDRAATLRSHGAAVTITTLVDEQPSQALLDFADDYRADLIALATHGEGGVRRLVLGSVADKVARAAECPVLLFRPVRHAESKTVELAESALQPAG